MNTDHTLQRMEAIVANAYKAITLLKEKNQSLKAENSALKKKLLALQLTSSSQQPDATVILAPSATFTEPSREKQESLLDKSDDDMSSKQDALPPPEKTGAPTMMTVEAVRTEAVVVRDRPLIPHQPSKLQKLSTLQQPLPQPTPAPTPTRSDLVEIGWSPCTTGAALTASSASFSNAKTLQAWLETVSSADVHSAAQLVNKHSEAFYAAAFAKALCGVVSKLVSAAVGVLCHPQKLSSPLRAALHDKLAVLGSLLVSVATRTKFGLLNVRRVLAALKNICMATVRNAVPSPLLSTLTAHVHDSRAAAEVAVAEGSPADEDGDEEEGLQDSPGESGHAEAVAALDSDHPVGLGGVSAEGVCSPVDEANSAMTSDSAGREAELYELFGFADGGDSSSDDNDGDDEDNNDNGEECNEFLVTEGNATERDQSDSEGAAAQPIVSPAGVVHPASGNCVANDRAMDTAHVTTSPESVLWRQLLSDSGKLSVFFSVALRLGMHSLVKEALVELLLGSSRHRPPLGVAVGFLDSFPAPLLIRMASGGAAARDIQATVDCILSLWAEQLDSGETATARVPPHGGERTHQLALQLQDSIAELRQRVGACSDATSKPLSACLRDIGMQSGSIDAAVDINILSAVRRTGVLKALISVRSEVTLASGSVFAILGLGFVPRDAERMENLVAAGSALPLLWRNVSDHTENDSSGTDTYKEFVSQSCCLGATPASQLPAAGTERNEECLAMSHFLRHWESVIPAQAPAELSRDLGTAFRAVFSVFHSLLLSEYDPGAGGGWRTGQSGEGLSIRTRLRNRMEVGLDLLRKVPQWGWLSVDGQYGMRGGGTLSWLHSSSVEEAELVQAAEFVDHCVAQAQSAARHGSDASVSYASDASQSTDKARTSLAGVCHDIAALIYLATAERTLFLFMCSVRAFLIAARRHAASGGHAVSTHQALSVFLSTPAPWGAQHGSRADFTLEVVAALRFSQSTSGAPVSGFCTTSWLSAATRRLPVFVINLDRRPDRWRHIALLSDRCGITAIRVRAVDGAAKSALAAGSEYGDDSQDAQRSQAAEIPAEDVSLTWDSSLNAKFDAGCLVNPHTPLTAAERACAASHLKVWRTIAVLRTGDACAQDHLGRTSGGQQGIDTAQQLYAMHGITRLGSDSARGLSKKGEVEKQTSEGDQTDAGDYYIIFEDDANVSAAKQDDFRREVAYLMKRLPSFVDVLYLGAALPKRAAEFRSHLMHGGAFLKVNYIWMLHAYVLRGRAVDALLSNLPINSPVDNFLASLIYHKQLVAFVASDELVGQSQRTLKGRRHESDIRHSGRITMQREYASRAAGANSVGMVTAATARGTKRIRFADDEPQNADSSKQQRKTGDVVA